MQNLFWGKVNFGRFVGVFTRPKEIKRALTLALSRPTGEGKPATLFSGLDAGAVGNVLGCLNDGMSMRVTEIVEEANGRQNSPNAWIAVPLAHRMEGGQGEG
jgi:hypothetical protein